ncbi:MAG: methionyl-tRNA formyltransferase [Candidatus Omnitrophica bacterium 4484_70.2]|nr:MAG: methionyl-tRNA formyltransferase [Candidatus Omnitrophica bacterium 4484_70.2]
MRGIYFGSDEFSQSILEEIMKKNILKITKVVTTPDKPQKRGLNVLPTPVKKIARKYRLEVFEPFHLDEKVYSELKKEDSDLIIVVGYGKILPPYFLSLPRIIPLGIHPSLLPLYRGAAPIQRVLLEGERYTGVSIFKLNEKVDSGPLIIQKKIEIKMEDDYFSLFSKLVNLAAEALEETAHLINEKKFILFPQKGVSSYAPKIRKEEANIDWNLSAEKIYNLIRAFKKWPGGYTFYKGRRVKIIEAEIISQENKGVPSQIINWGKEGIDVATGGGVLRIKKIQPEGKRIMEAFEFVCGYRIKKGDSFSWRRQI